ncbi:Metallo-dependent phosphatase-like protein [Multifurca ochricompacta]|uniref:Metallo-dependent phosphatase-like protein n=1 Tax=Multifurca ochricompacta TaxID=376703 RepID=A0AAD4QJE1_9AGAM|nr:Metallo-dependent phosphatase-like protein [Multifurca ochricompacta]
MWLLFHLSIWNILLVAVPEMSSAIVPLLEVDYHSCVAANASNTSVIHFILNFLLSLLFLNFARTPLLYNAQESSSGPDSNTRKFKIICLSDTHGHHRDLDMPKEGDLLIHAGDFTAFGNEEHAKDFNDWLGSLPYKHKIVVEGNHEVNVSWMPKEGVSKYLTNAQFLRNDSIEIKTDIDDRNKPLKIYGSRFYWKCRGRNPYYDLIPQDADIVVVHNPPLDHGDDGKGCPALLERLAEIRPKLVVSGHMHGPRGVRVGRSRLLRNTLFVNAANVESHKALAREAIVVNM